MRPLGRARTSTAATGRASPWKGVIERARAALGARDVAEAEAIAARILERLPRLPDATAILGYAAAARDDAATAIAHLENALTGRRDAIWLTTLASLHRRESRIADAVRCPREAVSRAGRRTTAPLIELGRVLTDTDEYAEAANAFSPRPPSSRRTPPPISPLCSRGDFTATEIRYRLRLDRVPSIGSPAVSAYLVFRFDVSDAETYGSYVAQVGPLLIRQGAEVLVVSNDPRVLEGPNSGMNVVIKFETEDRAMAFYSSPEYEPLKSLRLRSTTNHSCVLAPGFTMPTLLS